MEEMKKQACQLALTRIFKESFFDICTIDKVLKLTGTIPDPEVYGILNTIHCCHYSLLPLFIDV